MNRRNDELIRQKLADEFSSRKKRNRGYSLRAFAASLGLSRTVVNEVITGRRKLSPKNIEKLQTKMTLSPEEWNALKGNRTKETVPEVQKRLLQEDEFLLISNWYYLVILNLARLDNISMDAQSIAHRIGVSTVECQNALLRLERLGYIKNHNGNLTRTAESLRTTSEVSSRAIKKFHQENLERAREKIESTPVEDRFVGATTMPINPRQLPQAKKLMEEFQRKLSACLVEGELTEVYTLTQMLLPQLEGKKK